MQVSPVFIVCAKSLKFLIMGGTFEIFSRNLYTRRVIPGRGESFLKAIAQKVSKCPFRSQKTKANQSAWF